MWFFLSCIGSKLVMQVYLTPTVIRGHNELGYDKHIFKSGWSFSAQIHPTIMNPADNKHKWPIPL
jgi:hypothetical protein